MHVRGSSVIWRLFLSRTDRVIPKHSCSTSFLDLPQPLYMAPKFVLSVLRSLRRIRGVFHLIELRLFAGPPQSTHHNLLLDLPRELRLQIYDALAHLPVDCPVDRIRQTPRKRLARSTSTRLPIPWLSLTLVCKTIKEDLQLYTLASGNATYTLEVDNLEHRRLLTDKVTWRRIPCPPSNVRTLRADLVLRFATDFWGSGGPMGILSDLYQVLNCFIHNGPVLTRRRPLPTPIHLDTLLLQIHMIGTDAQFEAQLEGYTFDQAEVDALKQQLWQELKMYVTQVVDRGVLFGAVDKIVCRWADDGSDNGVECQWEVCAIPVGDMTEWNAYNFHWGVPGSSSLTTQANK
ncbi:hypothetical protein MSAN_01942600 [Mycena sanguinolenta]|uniref:Uncharacterized protein n=1 Tax=Mycena sanguinolenta TaxID=230812 RepID=A0A8H7CNT7_9AGAR|nr:hypothetical protein MSAN_01942600 [Mycena sanguinolenta]